LGIGRLRICDWSNLQKRDTEIPFPKWTQVEEAIRALNNNNLNDLYLIPQVGSLETFLVVGGGAGRYPDGTVIWEASVRQPSKPPVQGTRVSTKCWEVQSPTNGVACIANRR
jgi:hypothetical protein